MQNAPLPNDSPDRQASPAPAPADRRTFVSLLSGVALAGFAWLTPLVSALAALLYPLRQRGVGGEPVRMTSLDSLPADGTPRRVPVIAPRVNAWTTSQQPVGAVYLRRTGTGDVMALQVVCPHAGCTVDYQPVLPGAGQQAGGYVCPCHKAAFDLDGRRLPGANPSPRDLDQLEVEIRAGDQVWVHFQTFLLGTPNKVATS